MATCGANVQVSLPPLQRRVVPEDRTLAIGPLRGPQRSVPADGRVSGGDDPSVLKKY